MRQYRSRLSEVEEKNSIKSAVIFGGLTILIIAAALIFGIPLFSKLLNLTSKNDSTTQSVNTVILPPPNLASLPQNTNQQSIIIKGTTLPNAKVRVYFGNSSDDTVADGNGDFNMNIGLSKGANTIYAKTVDDAGNQSEKSTTYTVNYSTQVPNLTVNVPQNNQTFYGSTQQNLEVQGSTDTSNSVTINDHVAIVDPTGKFDLTVGLNSGDNQIKVVATDQAGNKKEIDLKVTFNP